jgi:TrmH family RNA methyltransferase
LVIDELFNHNSPNHQLVTALPNLSELEGLRVVLVAPRNPLNIGAAARAMSNFGFSRLRVVNPYEIAFREAQSAVGAAELLAHAEEYKTVADAVSDCSLVIGTTAGHDRELQHELRVLQHAAPLIRSRLTSTPVAILFGSEKRGLRNEDLNHCHFLLHIPTRDDHVSMNLGQAVAVCLYEIVRSADTQGEIPSAEPGATGAELERLTAVLLQALAGSGYSNPNSAAAIEEKVRRLVRRLNLSPKDAEVLLGMMRQMAWKIREIG